jgi:uncharacterized protein YdiU (UPF0061 family)
MRGMELQFDNRFVRELPGETAPPPGARQVEGALWSRVAPVPVRAPRILAWSKDLAALLGLGEEDMRDPGVAGVFAGNGLLPGMFPYAANYGGHQFGHWAGSWATGARSALARCSTAAAGAGNCSSRALARPRTRATPTAALCFVRRSVNSCAARPCTTSASPPRVPCA